jgi:hypothetical protein
VYAATILDLPRETIWENSGLPEGVDVRVTLGDERSRS